MLLIVNIATWFATASILPAGILPAGLITLLPLCIPATALQSLRQSGASARIWYAAGAAMLLAGLPYIIHATDPHYQTLPPPVAWLMPLGAAIIAPGAVILLPILDTATDHAPDAIRYVRRKAGRE